MRKHVVVFVDVERHEAADGRDAIERVEEEPSLFQRTPPRFDHPALGAIFADREDLAGRRSHGHESRHCSRIEDDRDVRP
jgi:hypothetical protein